MLVRQLEHIMINSFLRNNSFENSIWIMTTLSIDKWTPWKTYNIQSCRAIYCVEKKYRDLDLILFQTLISSGTFEKLRIVFNVECVREALKDNFEIGAPPLTLAKTVPNEHIRTISNIYQPYMYLNHIYHQNGSPVSENNQMKTTKKMETTSKMKMASKIKRTSKIKMT